MKKSVGKDQEVDHVSAGLIKLSDLDLV